jgi:hypothetical protein
VTLLVAGLTVAGRSGLGTLLTAAFVLQATPSLWTAYRTPHLTGVAAGTWLLILGELSCWTIFGLHQADPRLITLGVTGVTASALMLARLRRTHRPQPRSEPTHTLTGAELPEPGACRRWSPAQAMGEDRSRSLRASLARREGSAAAGATASVSEIPSLEVTCAL